MNLFQSLAGMTEVSITGPDVVGTLERINGENIPIFESSTQDDVTLRLIVYHRDFPHLKRICEKRGDELTLRRKRGLYWTGKALLRRPVLLFGLAFLLALAMFLPTRVLFVRVEGNSQIPVNQILEQAGLCGISFGANRREVRSEQVKNQLLERLPQLQWAGVNTAGCVAVITVRERAEPEKAPEFPQVGSIVASRDGIVLSCTATRGNLQCRVGQAVKEGQVLISAYTDCGLCIQATMAQGEIFARTSRTLEVITPNAWTAKEPSGPPEKKFSLIFGKKRINLWKDSGICDTSCGRMYKEYHVTLPGGFVLPIALAVQTCTPCETYESPRPQSECEAGLRGFARDYLASQMNAGQILRGEESVCQREDCFLLSGSYICTEMIGKVRKEQIGEYHGKDN